VDTNISKDTVASTQHQMALSEQYYELTKKHRLETGPRTVVLMQCGKFFEIYGRSSDEEGKLSPLFEVARMCSLRVARHVSSPDGRMSGVPLNSVDKIVETLLHEGWTVAIYRQSDVPGRHDRSLTNMYTPGTFFSQNIGVSNNLLVVWIEYRPPSVVRNLPRILYGAACLDNMTGTVTLDETVCSPARNDSSDYDWVQELCVVHNPRELRIVSANDHSEPFAVAAERLSATLLPQCCIRRHTSTEENVTRAQKQTYQDAVVEMCYGSSQTPESLTLLSYPQATNAFTLLLAEANASDPSLTRRLSRPVITTVVPRLLMANHSLRQLNIVNAGTNGPNIRYSSALRAICDGCQSNMGRREVARRVNAPLVDSVAIDRRLSEIAFFVNRPLMLEAMRKILRCLPDAETDFRTVVHKIARPDMLACNFRLYFDRVLACVSALSDEEGVDGAGGMVGRMEAAKGAAQALLAYTKHIFRPEPADLPLLPDKADEVGYAARWLSPDDEPESQYSRAYREYTAALQEVEEVRGILTHALREANSSRTSSRGPKQTTQPPSVYLDDSKGSIILRTTQHRGKQLQHWVSRMKTTASVHVSMQEELRMIAVAGSSVRVENDYIAGLLGTLERARTTLIEAAQREYSRVLEWYSERERLVRDTVDFVAALDAVTTGAHMAVANRYCRPELAHEGDVSWFRANGLRHMLAERIDSDELFVANDLEFGGGAEGGIEASGMLLFGTNASGKSTLIKSVGIAVVLAQAGFYVPAQGFAIRPYTAIYTRILGNDDLFRGLSTFAVEMTEFNAILRNANRRSLVLGDELCSGTETISAISIFASGLVALDATSCTYLFATHFHEIVRLKCVQELGRLICKHLEVRYDAEADALIYDRRLADGPGDSIYGLEVCRSLKMPQEFLDRAYEVRALLLPEGRSVLGAKTSRYSSKKVRGVCELCGAQGEHVHHLVHQADADEGRMVEHVRVDAAANLINVCEPCHARLHEEGEAAVRHRKAKTVDGRTVLVGLREA
jgi:DNA mismatch repair protein MutS